MGERAGRTAMGALATGAVMVSRRLLTVVEQPANPVNVGPTAGVGLTFVLRGISLTEEATLFYQWEGETGFLAAGTLLSGTLVFTPNSPNAEIVVTTTPMSVNSLDRVLVLTFSGAANATFVGDPSLTILLKASNPSAGLTVRNDNYIVVRNTIDNVLNVLANDTASAPISIAGLAAPVSGVRIANDSRSLLYNAPNSVLAPFNFNYVAVVPTTLETAQGRVTLEVEDTFTAQNVAINIPYASSRQVNVLLDATPDGRVVVSAIGSPSDGNAEAEIVESGGAILFTVPRDQDTGVGSSTLSFTVRHTRTNATLTRTLTVTYATQDALLGGPGVISGLPWASGATGTQSSKNLQTQRNRNHDVTMTFGPRGKGDATKAAGWTDIRGGDITGVALQGVFSGLRQADDWILALDETRFIPIITYDQWPFIYARGGAFKKEGTARADMFSATGNGTFNDTGGLGTTDDIYDAFGAKLKRIVEHYGWPAVVLRMNHEMNGTASYPHFIENVAQLDPFIAGTRRAITRIRAAAASTQFKLYVCLNFSRNTNGSGMAGPDAWVGKQYCEILELDFYDRNPPVPITDAASMNRYLNNTRGTSSRWKMRDGITPLPGCNGPATWADFARQIGVGFAIGEWGVMTDPNTHPGAEGDNPVFIEGVWNFFNNINDVLWYECYFNQSDSDLNKVPKARAMYLSKWGRSSGPADPFDPASYIFVPALRITSASPGDIIDGSVGFDEECTPNNPNASVIGANKVCDWRDTEGRQHRDGTTGETTYDVRSTGNNACWTGGVAKYVSASNLTLSWKQIHGNIWNNDKALNMKNNQGGDTHLEGFYFDGVGLDGIGPPSAGDRSFRTYLKSIVMRNIRDDCIQNDSLYPVSAENCLLQGHGILSQRPGEDANPPWTEFISEFRKCIFWSMRQPYDTDEGGNDRGYPGSKRVGPFVDLNTQNQGVVSGANLGYGSKFFMKSESIHATKKLYKCRLNIQDCIYRVDAPPVEGPRIGVFPELGDGIGTGSHNGSFYRNFKVLYFGGDGWDTHWGQYQSKATLKAMGIDVIDNTTTAWNMWVSVFNAFQAANGWNGDNYAWNRKT